MKHNRIHTAIRALWTTRSKFIAIALSLLLTTTALSTSAYLTSTAAQPFTFTTASGANFGISISGNQYLPDTLIPGQVATVEPVVSNEGIIPCYVFVEINCDEELIMSPIMDGWTLVDGTTNVYAYSSSNGDMVELESGSTTPVFKTITLDGDAEEGSSCTLTVTAYAIQSEALEVNAAQSVWGLLRP